MSLTGKGLWRTRLVKQFVQTVSQVSGLSTGLWRTRLVKQFVQTVSQVSGPTPSIAFRHLTPNSARFNYATEGTALFIFAQLSSDAVSALLKVRVPNKPYGFCER